MAVRLIRMVGVNNFYFVIYDHGIHKQNESYIRYQDHNTLDMVHDKRQMGSSQLEISTIQTIYNTNIIAEHLVYRLCI